MFRRLKSATDLLGIEPLLSLVLLATGLAGTAFALFMGKVFAAAILAVLCIGILVRFKRGRVQSDRAFIPQRDGAPDRRAPK